MTMLILGLILFLGVHSVRVLGEALRTSLRQRMGDNGYKLAYTLLSVSGFVLIVVGYAATRESPQILWIAPVWTRHVAALLTIPAFVLLVAAYVPGNSIKAGLHHPMVLAVKLWAFAHLVANGMLADLLLFGGFLAWSALSFRAARGRDRAAGTVYPPAGWCRRWSRWRPAWRPGPSSPSGPMVPGSASSPSAAAERAAPTSGGPRSAAPSGPTHWR